jgi:hypothetical protein
MHLTDAEKAEIKTPPDSGLPGVMVARPPRYCGAFVSPELIGMLTTSDRVSTQYCGTCATIG